MEFNEPSTHLRLKGVKFYFVLQSQNTEIRSTLSETLGAVKHSIVFLATGFKRISRRRSHKQFHALFLVMTACNIEFLLHWVLLTTIANLNLSTMFWILVECTRHLYSSLHVLQPNGYESIAKPHWFWSRNCKQIKKKENIN